MKLTPQASIWEIIHEDSKKLTSNPDLSSQEQFERLQVFNENLDALKDSLAFFFKVKNKDEYTGLFKRVFATSSENGTEKSLVFVLWETIWGLYNKLYSSNPEKSSNTLGILASTSKDLANLLVVNFIQMLKDNLLLTIRRNAQDHDFKEMKGIMAQFAEQFFNIFDESSLDSDRVSIIFAQAILEFSHEFFDKKNMSKIQFPFKVFQKLEDFIRMSFENDEFHQKLKNSSEAEFIYSRVIHFTLILHEYVENLNAIILGPQIRYLQDYLSKFQVIDLISNLPTPGEEEGCSNAYLRKVQERLIRSYVSLHIKIDTKTLDDMNKNNYYTRERLNQVWIIISKYCKYENYFKEELQNCWDIIRTKEEQDPTFGERPHEIFTREVLASLFKNCLFNQDSLNMDEIAEQGNLLESSIESLYEHQKNEDRALWNKLANYIHEPFKRIIQEGETLEKLYNENNPLFYKQYLITENKVNGFAWVIDFLSRIMEGNSSNENKTEFLKTFDECLCDLLVSPVLFLIDFQSNERLRTLFSDRDFGDFSQNSLEKIRSTFVKLGEKTIDLIQIIKQNSIENKNIAYLLGKIGASFGSRYNSVLQEKEPYSNDLRIGFQIKSKLAPVVFMRYLDPAGSEGFDNMIVDLVKFYKSDLKTTIESLVDITFYLMKQKITENSIGNLISFGFFYDSTLSFDTDQDEVNEYLREKFFILTDMISNLDPTKNFEEDLLWRLSALDNFLQLFDVSHSTFEELWIKNEIMPKISQFTFYIMEGFQKLILEYSPNINSITYLSELSIQPKANSMFPKEDSLKEFARFALDLIGKQLGTINSGLNYIKYNADKEKPIKSLWDVFSNSIEKFDERIILMCSLGDDKGLIDSFVKSLWDCYEGLLEQMTTMKSNKQGTSIPVHKKKKFGKGKGKRKGLFASRTKTPDLEDFMDNVKESADQPEIEQKNEKLEDEKLKEMLNVEFFKKLLLKLMLFSVSVRKGSILEEASSIKKQAFLDILNEIKPFILSQGEIMPNIKQVKGFGAEIYPNKIINRIRIISPILSNLRSQFEKSFSTKMESALEVEFELFQDTLNLLVNEVKYLITELKIEDLLEMNQQFIRVDFLSIFRECIFSLIDFTFQKLEYYLIKGEMLEDIYQNFNLICLAVKKFRKMIVGHNTAKEYLESFFNNKTGYKLTLLMIFVLHNPIQLKKFIEDKEFLSIVVNYSEYQLYNIAEVCALQAYDPEIILSVKLKSLAYLDKTGKRIYQNSSIKYLEKYWSQELQRIWNEKFSIQKEITENSTGANIIEIKENKGFFLTY